MQGTQLLRVRLPPVWGLAASLPPRCDLARAAWRAVASNGGSARPRNVSPGVPKVVLELEGSRRVLGGCRY